MQDFLLKKMDDFHAYIVEKSSRFLGKKWCKLFFGEKENEFSTTGQKAIEKKEPPWYNERGNLIFSKKGNAV